MRSVISDLFFSCSHPRGIVRSFLYMVPVAAVVLLRYRGLYAGSTSPAVTNHEVLSINMALNARMCGQPGRLSSRYSAYDFVASHREFMGQPFRALVAAQAGSVDDYCRTVAEPYVLAENSTMWLTWLALRLRPDLSPDGLGRFLGGLRVSMLLMLGFALVRGGASVALSGATMIVACEILQGLGIRETPYPFLLALTLLHGAVYGLAAAGGITQGRPAGLAALAFAMGALAAFSGSVRTVLLLMSATMFALFLLGAYFVRQRSRRSLALAIVPIVVFAIGYAAYVQVFVEPLRTKGNPAISDYAYHTFAHPLVLGLAVPGNAFTEREGLRWDDMAGLALARRVDPGVALLGPGYESALLTYYGRLWRRHPREMALVYLGKLRWTGSGVFQSVADVASRFGIPRAPAEWLDRATNGIALLAFALLTLVAAAGRYVRASRVDGLIVAMVTLGALAAIAEAFLTHSLYSSMYYNELLFFLFVGGFFWIQTAVDFTVRRVLPVPSGADLCRLA